MAALRSATHDVVYAHESSPQAPDAEILAAANADQRILLTEDHDFGALVVRDGGAAVGLVLLELHGLSADAKAVRVIKIFGTDESDFVGAFTVVEPARVRRRPL